MDLLPFLAAPMLILSVLFNGQARSCLVDTGSAYTILFTGADGSRYVLSNQPVVLDLRLHTLMAAR